MLPQQPEVFQNAPLTMMDIKISPAKAHSFTFDDSLEPWNFNLKDWMAADDSKVDGIATATIVFNPEGKVLLVSARKQARFGQ